MTNILEQLQAALGTSYRVIRELGGGGMSRVFLAEETRLGRQVVIKVLPPEMGAAVNTERFEREIQLAARLQHPHIVPLLTAASSGDLLYYIMPFIAGESLRAKLAREGELPVAEAAKILREVVDALSYAHRNGVVHRDIKPDNVLLSDGHAVVTDFGVAKAVSASSGSSLTSLGVALGTPAYMAPEQAAADPHVDHRADIYAVGALAYEMLSGRTPFTAPTAQALLAAHITQTPEPVTKHRTAVPVALNNLLMRCLEKRAADRWQSAAELLGQLEAYATPSTGGMTPTSSAPAVSSGTEEAIRKSHPVRVALLFAAAAVGVTQRVHHFAEDLGRFLYRQLALTRQLGPERFAGDIGHDVVEDVTRGRGGEQRHDVRMLQPGGELDLPLEALGVDRRAHLRRQHLDDHLAAQLRFLGQEDAAHPTATELAEDAVAGAQRGLQLLEDVGHQDAVRGKR